jgi:phosphinothricin acetyltransferase
VTEIILRDATEADLPAIFAIYNDAVLRSTATWDLIEVGRSEQVEWLHEHRPPYSVIVAEAAGEVVGWGSLSRYRPRSGYRFAVEDTLYIRDDFQRRGIGRALLLDLLQRARDGGFRAVLAKISGDNEASIALHAACGFFEAGRELQVGYKFDRWLDLVTMQLLLND